MDELLSLLKGVAPALATAVAGPLGGAAVSAIAGKLIFKIKTIQTPEHTEITIISYTAA